MNQPIGARQIPKISITSFWQYVNSAGQYASEEAEMKAHMQSESMVMETLGQITYPEARTLMNGYVSSKKNLLTPAQIASLNNRLFEAFGYEVTIHTKKTSGGHVEYIFAFPETLQVPEDLNAG